MKKLIAACLLCMMISLHSRAVVSSVFDDMDQHMYQMHEQMEQVFAQMNECTQSTKLDAPDYALEFHEKEDDLVLALMVPKTITASDISVEVEDGVLDVVIQSHNDRFELVISANQARVSSSTTVRHEKKTDKGEVQMFSSGASHMSQTLPLPTRVDVQRRAPQADLTDGVLTITVAKKGSQKISVTTVAVSTQQVAHESLLPSHEDSIDFEK